MLGAREAANADWPDHVHDRSSDYQTTGHGLRLARPDRGRSALVFRRAGSRAGWIWPDQTRVAVPLSRQLGPMPVQNEVEVSEFDPDRILTLRSVSGPTPFRYRYVLEPSAGGTLLRLQGEISGDGLPGLLSMVGGFAEPFFRRGMEANLRTLKGLIEGD